MKTRIHALAGLVGLLTILIFWTSTIVSELQGHSETIAWIKSMILKGMLILIPAMIIVGFSGRILASERSDPILLAKLRRMMAIAFNGLLILVPSAVYLSSKASAGSFDAWFYGVQALELMAGAANVVLMVLNARDGLRLTGTLRRPSP